MADLAYYKSLEDYDRIKDYLDLDEPGFQIPMDIPEFKPDFSKAIIVDNLPLVGKDKIERLTDMIKLVQMIYTCHLMMKQIQH